MSNKQFISNLSSTYADVRKLDAKKINLKGKNILEYIKENETVILDERGTNADDTLDIWNSYVTKDDDGNVIINTNAKPLEHSMYWGIYEDVTESQFNTLQQAVKVIDNEVLGANDEHIMFWQTEGLTDCYYIFYMTSLSEFSSDLSNLTNGEQMFSGCTALTSFNGNLSSLTDGKRMFYRSRLESFPSDLSSLTNGSGMFLYCNQLTSFSSALPNLTDGGYMFSGCTALTSFNSNLSSLKEGHFMFQDCHNLTSFNSNLSSLKDGKYMFKGCRPLTSFSSDLSSLTEADSMFNYCENLSEFSSDLSSLTNGSRMFAACNNITSFSSDLSSLTNGYFMFECCSNLTSFNSDLPCLTNGSWMFDDCSNLESFSSDLSSLTNGHNMFYSCTALTSFCGDLSSLTNGENMFADCDNLTSFNGNLSSLTKGFSMFSDCKLDAQSVANIIHFIPQRDTKHTNAQGEGNIYIGVGITNTDAAKQTFAKECECDDWADLNKEFDDKNWGVQWQFNGPASYSLRDPRPSTAVYTKLEEVFMPTEEEIAAAKEKGEHIETPHYEYVSQDGDNYYNIHWYHDSNTNNEGYDYFESLEMATLAYSVLPRA